MNHMKWRHVDGYENGRIIEVTDPSRMGNCWLRGRIFKGDIAMVTSHSGDCFFQFILIERFANGTKLHAKSEFGAYAGVGEPSKMQLTAREYHLLSAGEMIKKVIPDVEEMVR